MNRPKKSDGISGPVAVPPPVFYLAALLVGVLLNSVWPASVLATRWALLFGGLLIVASILIMPFVLIRFRRAGTSFDVRRAASALITEGPYRFSRNPAYLALTLLYLGVSLMLNILCAVLLVLPVVFVMDLWVVRREERHLEARFGEEYLRYKARVRRWL